MLEALLYPVASRAIAVQLNSCKIGHCLIVALFVQAPPQADGSVPSYVPLTMDILSGTDESIVELLQQGIQTGSCIVCSMSLAVQVPPQG